MAVAILAQSDRDEQLAAALRRLLLTTSCPKYVREPATAWLAERSARS